MRKILLVLLFVCVQGVGWACDSYQDCMYKCKEFEKESGFAPSARPMEISVCAQAIDYKLDKIWKTLNEIHDINLADKTFDGKATKVVLSEKSPSN